MPSRFVKLLLAFVFLALSSLVNAGAGVRPESLPSDTLNARGRRIVESGQRTPEAYLWLSIVARRYYQKPRDAEARRAAVTAMHWLGVWHMLGQPDYAKAYEYTATAIALAREDGIDDELPNLYNNMSSLMLTANMLGVGDKKEDSDNLKLAYRSAVATRNHTAMRTTIDNMLNYLGDTIYDAEIADFKRRRISPSPLLDYTRWQIRAYDALRQGDTARAIAYVRRSGQAARPYDKARAQGAELKEATLLEKQGRLPQGRAIMLRLLEQTISERDTLQITYLYRRLADNYEKSAMDDSAKECRYRWLTMREQIRERSENALQAAQMSRQMEQVNQELRDMSLARQRRERQLLWLGGILAITLLGAGWVVTAYRSQSHHMRQLYEQNLKLLEAQNPPQTDKPKYEASPVDTGASDELYMKVKETMQRSPEIYDPNFSLDRLAALMGINSRYLSQAINQHGGNFSQMLSSLRITEACRRFNHVEAYGRYTVEGVAQSVGMSRSSFGSLFKKATGLTPAQYRRQARERETGA